MISAESATFVEREFSMSDLPLVFGTLTHLNSTNLTNTPFGLLFVITQKPQ
jgi:hypothetical protein